MPSKQTMFTTMHQNQSPRVRGPVAPAPPKLTATAGRPGFNDSHADKAWVGPALVSRAVQEERSQMYFAPFLLVSRLTNVGPAQAALAGRRFAAAFLPRLFGTRKNSWSHHKGATGRVQTGDQWLPVPCHCQLGQDIPSIELPSLSAQF